MDSYKTFYEQSNLYNVVYYAINKLETDWWNNNVKDSLEINFKNTEWNINWEIYNDNFKAIKDWFYTIWIKYSDDPNEPESVELKYLWYDAADFNDAYCYDENTLFKIMYNWNTYNCPKWDSLILRVKTVGWWIKKIEIRKWLKKIWTIYL